MRRTGANTVPVLYNTACIANDHVQNTVLYLDVIGECLLWMFSGREFQRQGGVRLEGSRAHGGHGGGKKSVMTSINFQNIIGEIIE